MFGGGVVNMRIALIYIKIRNDDTELWGGVSPLNWAGGLFTPPLCVVNYHLDI